MAVFMCPVCGKRTVKPGSHIGEADLGTYTLDCDDCREVLYSSLSSSVIFILKFPTNFSPEFSRYIHCCSLCSSVNNLYLLYFGSRIRKTNREKTRMGKRKHKRRLLYKTRNTYRATKVLQIQIIHRGTEGTTMDIPRKLRRKVRREFQNKNYR